MINDKMGISLNKLDFFAEKGELKNNIDNMITL